MCMQRNPRRNSNDLPIENDKLCDGQTPTELAAGIMLFDFDKAFDGILSIYGKKMYPSTIKRVVGRECWTLLVEADNWAGTMSSRRFRNKFFRVVRAIFSAEVQSGLDARFRQVVIDTCKKTADEIRLEEKG